MKPRICPECGSSFIPKKDDSRLRFCSKECRRTDVARRFSSNNPDYKDNYYKTNKESYYWRALRSRAKRLGVGFDLSLEDYINLINGTTHCPVFGAELKRSLGPGGKTDNSPSVDRFDSKRGYTRDNVVVISDRANRLKNDASADELDKVVRWMREHQNKIDTQAPEC